ncbi:hypothetical protein VNO77_01860 [Canavalia gladiata]|uniref:RPW8 domain-containing protein n=1 Tax=Canavalia gladiata TaxID=3824 RepID=A0AAN9MWS8_CANGL
MLIFYATNNLLLVIQKGLERGWLFMGEAAQLVAISTLFEERLKMILEIMEKAQKSESNKRILRSTLKNMTPVVKEIKLYNEHLNPPREEIKTLIKENDAEEKEELVCKSSSKNLWYDKCFSWLIDPLYKDRLGHNEDDSFAVDDSKALTQKDIKDALYKLREILELIKDTYYLVCTEMQIVKNCKVVKELSQGHSILDFNTELLTYLQRVLDVLEDNIVIKECFMDLALFTEDQRIPVTALIDIWARSLLAHCLYQQMKVALHFGPKYNQLKMSLPNLPEDFGNLCNLRSLYMTSCAKCELPYSAINLENLKLTELISCTKLDLSYRSCLEYIVISAAPNLVTALLSYVMSPFSEALRVEERKKVKQNVENIARMQNSRKQNANAKTY